MSEEHARRDELVEIERGVQERWEREKADEADVSSRKKVLITFPYAYMNGKLHLGHMFSFSKADFYCRFKRAMGYNTLFPYAFHCTGMPIKAGADKLKDELDGVRETGQKGIMLSMGIEEKDVPEFTDARKWLYYFPTEAQKTLKRFGAPVDWRRCFITTEENVFYDSFVQWQFEKLRAQGRLSFGKRHSVFCPKDNQPCMDHDRQSGEGVLPAKRTVALVECSVSGKKYLICATLKKKEVQGIEAQMDSLSLCPGVSDTLVLALDQYVVAMYEGFLLILSEEAVSNMQAQEMELERLGSIAAEEIVRGECSFKFARTGEVYGTGILLGEGQMESGHRRIEYYEPEKKVVSRSGAKCIVALVDQWSLNYGEEGWKKLALKCISQMEMAHETRDAIDYGMGWLEKWACSRGYGLGTRLPWDKGYFIDSLSDSTIYMAFYTIKHHLSRDIWGKEALVDPVHLSYDFWECIFGSEDTFRETVGTYEEELGKRLGRMREEFRYFYPVDLRVSGKDLTNNHLLFFIYSHVSLFDEQFWPRRIFTNGHITLDGEKMSKSTGNFLTGEDAIERFGADAVRLVLAGCGDTNEDSNFSQQACNGAILKLYKLKSLFEAETASLSRVKGPPDALEERLEEKYREKFFGEKYAERFFYEMIKYHKASAIEAYESLRFRDAVTLGFYELLNLRESYNHFGNSDPELLLFFYKTILSLSFPIIPHLSSHLLDKLGLSPALSLSPYDQEVVDSAEFLRRAIASIKHFLAKKKRRGTLVLKISNEYLPWQKEVERLLRLYPEDIRRVSQEFDSDAFRVSREKVAKYASARKGRILECRKEVLLSFAEYIKKSTSAEDILVVDHPGMVDLPDISLGPN
jgi:leucyl-tRNA synthetase